MSIVINGTLDVRWPTLIDKRMGQQVGSSTVPYDSTEQALAALIPAYRAEGIVVYVRGLTGLDWYQFVGGIEDENLKKVDFLGGGGGATYGFSNGINEAGGAVKLGGPLNGATNITTNDNDFYIYNNTAGGANSALRVLGNSANALGALFVNNGAGGAIFATSLAGWAIQASQTTTGSGGVFSVVANGTGGYFGSTGGLPLYANKTGGSNAIQTIARFTSSGSTPANGIGIGIDLCASPTGGGTDTRAAEIAAKWVVADNATRVSEFYISGVNNAAESQIFTLAGTGQLTLNKYTGATFDATAFKSLGVDATGKLITFTAAAGGGTYTASGGLTMTANDVKLGGTLSTASATITTGIYQLTITGAPVGGGGFALLDVKNTYASASKYAIYASNSGGTAIVGQTVTTGTYGVMGTAQHAGAYGVYAANISGGIALMADASNFNIAIYGTTTASAGNLQAVIKAEVKASGVAPSVGIGGSIDYYVHTVTKVSSMTNQLISKWTDITDATRTSEFSITGVGSATTKTLLTLKGNGDIVAPSIRTFADDAAATADGTLATNSFYRVTGSTDLRIK